MTKTIVMLTLVLVVAPVGAKDRRDRDQGELPAAVRKVERETGGQVLRAERVNRDGQGINRIKVITPEGRVRVYRDDERRDFESKQESDGRR